MLCYPIAQQVTVPGSVPGDGFSPESLCSFYSHCHRMGRRLLAHDHPWPWAPSDQVKQAAAWSERTLTVDSFVESLQKMASKIGCSDTIASLSECCQERWRHCQCANQQGYMVGRELCPPSGSSGAVLRSDLDHQIQGEICKASGKAGGRTGKTRANTHRSTCSTWDNPISSSTGSSTCFYFAGLLALPCLREEVSTGSTILQEVEPHRERLGWIPMAGGRRRKEETRDMLLTGKERAEEPCLVQKLVGVWSRGTFNSMLQAYTPLQSHGSGTLISLI